MDKKDRLWEMRGELQMNLRFYESLSSLNQEALGIVERLKRDNIIHSFFISMGFIKIVVSEGDRPFRVQHPEILKEKFGVEYARTS